LKLGRFWRAFKAGVSKDIFPKLRAIPASCSTNCIHPCLLDFDDIDMMDNPDPMQLTMERKDLIIEQTLIGLYEPESNMA
jgi:hypothetical protein